MRREYFLAESLDDIDNAASILHHQLHIKENNIHVLGKDKVGIKQHHLHEGSIFEKSDLVRGAKYGTLLGAVLGITACAALSIGMPFWHESELIKQSILMTSLLGSLVIGCLIGSFFGLLQVNNKIYQFNNDLKMGKLLMFVDSNELEPIKQTLENQSKTEKDKGNCVVFLFDEYKN
mgnify:CR=1 FL=1